MRQVDFFLLHRTNKKTSLSGFNHWRHKLQQQQRRIAFLSRPQRKPRPCLVPVIVFECAARLANRRDSGYRTASF
jgi:hypothetical protein